MRQPLAAAKQPTSYKIGAGGCRTPARFEPLRDGSFSDVNARSCEVRFAPTNRHRQFALSLVEYERAPLAMTACLKRTVFPHPANCVTAMRHPPLCSGCRSFLRLLHHAHGFIRLHLATSHILFCHHLLRLPLGRWPSVLKMPIASRQAPARLRGCASRRTPVCRTSQGFPPMAQMVCGKRAARRQLGNGSIFRLREN